jgi:hypothetical protein
VINFDIWEIVIEIAPGFQLSLIKIRNTHKKELVWERQREYICRTLGYMLITCQAKDKIF